MLASPKIRRYVQLAVLSLGSATIGSIVTGAAVAEQVNMISAREALHSAYSYLKAATPDKGGHRANAMNLVNQAIEEVNAGIQYARQHGG